MKHNRLLKIAIIVIALIVFALMTVNLVMAQRNVSMLNQQAVELQSEVAQRVGKDVASLINGRESELGLLLSTQNFLQMERGAQINALSALVAAQSAYEELALLNSDGQEVARVGSLKVFSEDDLEDRSTLPEYEIPKASGQVYYSPMQFNEVSGEPFMVIAVPSFDTQSRKFNGILAATIRFRSIWDLMSGAQVPGDGIVYVVDADNRVIAHRDPSIVLQETRVELPMTNGFSSGLDGNEVAMAVSTQTFGTQAFHTVAEQQTNEALTIAETDMALTGVVIFILLVMVIIIVVAYRNIGKA